MEEDSNNERSHGIRTRGRYSCESMVRSLWRGYLKDEVLKDAHTVSAALIGMQIYLRLVSL